MHDNLGGAGQTISGLTDADVEHQLLEEEVLHRVDVLFGLSFLTR